MLGDRFLFQGFGRLSRWKGERTPGKLFLRASSPLQATLRENEASLPANFISSLLSPTFPLLPSPHLFSPISLQMEVNTMAPSLEIASESPLRSLVKACSWRLVAALITLSTSLFFSREYVVETSWQF